MLCYSWISFLFDKVNSTNSPFSYEIYAKMQQRTKSSQILRFNTECEVPEHLLLLLQYVYDVYCRGYLAMKWQIDRITSYYKSDELYQTDVSGYLLSVSISDIAVIIIIITSIIVFWNLRCTDSNLHFSVTYCVLLIYQ